MHGRPLTLFLVALGLPLSAWGQAAPASKQYSQTNIVSDSPATVIAKTYDPNSGSSWGIARSSAGPWAVANAAKGTVTVYAASGAIAHAAVTVPSGNPAKSPTGSPTGIVFNPSAEFALANGKPAQVLAVTLDGLGIGAATVNGVAYLYAPDFKSFRMNVCDRHFKHVPVLEAAMARVVDQVHQQAGLSPLNVQDIGSNLYVAFAEPDPTLGGILPVVKTGSGLVVGISPGGKVLRTLQTGQFLNSPRAVALAPGDFGSDTAATGPATWSQPGTRSATATKAASGRVEPFLRFRLPDEATLFRRKESMITRSCSGVLCPTFERGSGTGHGWI